MSINSLSSDLASRIRNAYNAKKETIEVPNSKNSKMILTVLKNEGYILNFSLNDLGNAKKNSINVNLKYKNQVPAISLIRVVSKPGKRVYSNIESLPFYHEGMGIYILSTSKGIMSDFDARKSCIGGEILISVF